jgi:hypothetical protein
MGEHWIAGQSLSLSQAQPSAPSPILHNGDRLTGITPAAAMAAGTAEPLLRPQAAAQTTPNFAIQTEGTFTMNGSGDLDGDPLNLSDDALVYAGKGFTINGNPA